MRKNPKNDEVRNIGINEIEYLQLLILAKIDFFSRPLSSQSSEYFQIKNSLLGTLRGSAVIHTDA